MQPSRELLTGEELCSAFDLMRQLTPEHELLQLAPTSPTAVYTTLVTLWMLTLQRLEGGASLNSVVKDVLVHRAGLLPDNKRVREGTLSKNSGAFSEARKRLPLEAVNVFADRVCRSLIDRTPSWFGQRRAYLLDGTTITLSPTDDLARIFPPATNQHGDSVWPILMLLVVHELQSGCALVPEVGAMYGTENTSEAKMAAAMARRLPVRSLVMADSAFGIFSVCQAMISQHHDILFRLTKSRYKSLVGRAKQVEQTADSTSHHLRWAPSVKDRLTNPDLTADTAVDVVLHHLKLESGEDLMLVTTLPCSSAEAAEAYSYRYDVEHDLRDFKVAMGVEKMRAKSEEMVQKELLCSVVAYNLVVEFRREAAKIAKLPPRRLSFKGVWDTFQSFLLRQAPCDKSLWEERYEKALKIAATDKLPDRPSGRSSPRKAHPRRPKSTKFMKAARKATENPDPTNKPPPK